MSQLPPPEPGAGLRPLGWGVALVLYLAVALAICFGGIGSTDVYVMEGIVADGAREMVRTGEWAVPRLHGEIYMYKPPLAYWLAAIPLQIWDRETAWTLRAPFALCAVLLGLSVYWLSARLLGSRRGLICALAASTGGLMVQKLHRAEFDMPLALGVGVAVVAACCNLASERQSPWLWWLCYLGLTVGFLAKGVPALMLFGPGLLLTAVATGRVKALFRPSHLAGVALFGLLAGGWVYGVVASAGWEAFDQPILEARHKGFTEWSWSTFGIALSKPLLVVGLFLPWSILLPIVSRRSWWHSLTAQERRLALGAAAFSLTGALAFTVVPTTESRYFLPLAAPLGLLFGMAAHAGGRGRSGRRSAVLLACALGLWLVHTVILEPRRVAKRSLRSVAEAFRPHLAEGETLWTTPVRKGFHHSGLFFYLGHQVRTVGPNAKPVSGSALVLFSDEPAGRPDYVVPVDYTVVEERRRRGHDFVLARAGKAAMPARDVFESAGIRAILGRAADWQLAHPRHEPGDWTNAVFYSGLLAAYRVTGEDRYLEELMRVGEALRWQPGRRERHADDHAIAQTYLDLYRIRRERRMIEPFRETVDRMMSSPPRWEKAHQTIDYWWSDALFMSPPALAKLAAATGEGKYLKFMDRLWREAHEVLYDPEERLFYRDSRKIGGVRKTFWSRGNAWVAAGIVRVLEELPEDQSSRQLYLAVYRELAERIAALQPADGLWRADLLASPLAAPGETSGTALFCYALAWGIDHGVLDRERYLPVVLDAWSALYGNVDEEGRLGWVQRPGVGPGEVRPGDWEVYGTGAFLLAGEAVLGLVGREESDSPGDDA